MRKILTVLIAAVLIPAAVFAEVRVKDIASIQGVRDNQLVGYGLVVGLNGTGDKQGTYFTVSTIVSMLQRMGIKVPQSQVTVKNVAAVMITATLPPFARSGSKLDVTVSSIGDAKDIQGGTLLMTPLKAVDGNIYALAQGPVSIGGFNVSGGAGAAVQKNHVTAGRVPQGATIERELPNDFQDGKAMNLVLKQPDFTTATRVTEAINKQFNSALAYALDSGTIRL
ncbi:MAG: flagellar basal body P-ring protein FlgI, partial [Nitrospirota bacterium]|nr:flagellar basal body P-ring protein FlgI [Nitrospirota bacterium]